MSKKWIKTKWIAGYLSGVLLSGLANAAEPAAPNVLLIVSDDQGIGDFEFTGNKTVQTPNLDQLAAQSAWFSNFVVAPACSPTRASLMTGRNHMKTGVWGVGPRNNLMRDEALMPHYFKAGGYKTGYFGKGDGLWQWELRPYHHCDEAEYPWGYDHLDPRMFTLNGIVNKKGWTCDISVDSALDFIKRQGAAPWWCGVAFIIPHLPWEPDDRFAKPYRDAGFSKDLANCYGSITQMDDAVGRLLKGLAELGHTKDTLIIFLSDNGPAGKLSEKEWADRNPLDLKGAKATVWENGIRVPLLVKWEGRIPPGIRPQFASVEDILPTLLDCIGLPSGKWPQHHPLDGISLRSALEDPAAKTVEREVFRVAISGEGAAGGRRSIVNDPEKVTLSEQHVILRGPKFKFHNFADGSTALYNLDQDPGETTDVRAQFPEIAERYEAELNRQYKEIIATGRAYRMPVMKVGRNQSDGYNRLEAIMAKRISGDLRGIGFDSIAGFCSAQDTVEYEILVEDAGAYDAVFSGKDLTNAQGWELAAGGQVLQPVKQDAERLVFGPVELAPGTQSIILRVSKSSADRKQRAYIQKVSFSISSENKSKK